ncbi:MAG: Crp/Fnr family transcriptional regulator [Vulcanimicrobiaceae bacterium]
MGADTTANDSFCQVEGRAWKLPAGLVRALLESSREFRMAMDRYLQAYVNMLGQMAGCNGLHSVLERCSRWLLMTQDRVDRSEFSMTHEFLAAMLGSRRSGVTVAAATLQGAGYISYRHGHVAILDRAGLESTACECYRAARDQFDAMLQLGTDPIARRRPAAPAKATRRAPPSPDDQHPRAP